MTTRQGTDRQTWPAPVERLMGIMVDAHISIMICLGLRLGLFRALKDAGLATSAEVAALAGLHERWVREWLRGQATAGVINYRGDGRFELPTELVAFLADENHVMFMGHNFDSLPAKMNFVERLPESFRTGLGLSYDDFGPETAAAAEELFRNWYRQVLVPIALPWLDGVVAKLKAGAKVADVGCGAGIALIEMAKAFPQSEFHGYEISEHAIARAEANREEAATGSVAFHNVTSEPLPADGSFDLITTFDCLHDMTKPDQAAAAIRAAVSPDGTWFIVDINSAPTFEGNLTNPFAPMLYTFSILACMSSGLSEPGGAGLGTCGLPEPSMRELANGAGFTRFRRLDLPHPVNAYYEARP